MAVSGLEVDLAKVSPTAGKPAHLISLYAGTHSFDAVNLASSPWKIDWEAGGELTGCRTGGWVADEKPSQSILITDFPVGGEALILVRCHCSDVGLADGGVPWVLVSCNDDGDRREESKCFSNVSNKPLYWGQYLFIVTSSSA